MPSNAVFNSDHVIHAYKEEEFNKIPERSLIDLVPNLSSDNSTHRNILGVWAKHLETVGTPHVITLHDGIMAIWKEGRVPYV